MRQVANSGKVGLVLLFAVGLSLAQTSSGTKSKQSTAKKTSSSSVSSRLSQMEQAISAQQQQIQQLMNQLQTRDSQVQQLQQQLSQTQASVSQAQQAAQAAQDKASGSVQADQLEAVKKDVTDLQGSATNYALNLQETQKKIQGLESPLAIHYRGVTITPGGFLAAETVYRTRGLGSDINTPFNSINFPGAGANHVSEFYGSGRQSRVSMLVEGKLADAKMSGYFESDFLSAGVTSTPTASNSYTMRQRQVWGQLTQANWTITGGQMWSLVTETKKGVDNRTEALPMTIDPNYTVGFSWARQWGFRVAHNFNNRFWLAGSLENPQTQFSQRNNIGNFVLGTAGTSGGLYNPNANYSFNAMPDIVLKAVAEPGFGHYEVFGIFRRFRDRVYPCVEGTGNPICSATGATTATGAFNSSRNGGGVGANARVTFAKQLDFGVHGIFGNGVGRYGTTNLPDATVNPDGTLALLRSYQGLGTIEWHKPRFDLYFNGGGEYVARHFQEDTIQGKSVGYGSPFFPTQGCYDEVAPPGNTGFGFGSLPSKTCQADTKLILEGTVGFWIKVYNGPHGRIQFGPQYSYVTRTAWAGSGGGAPYGVNNMALTSFRYYLP